MASNQPHCSHIRERRSSIVEPLDFSQPTRAQELEITAPSTLLHDIGKELNDFAQLQRLLKERNHLNPQTCRKKANLFCVVAGTLGLEAFISEDTSVAVAAAAAGAIGVILHFSAIHICSKLTRKFSDMLTSLMPHLETVKELILELSDVVADAVGKRTLDDVLLNLSEVKSIGDQLRAGHSSFSELQEMLRKVLHFGTMLQRTLEKYQEDWLLPGDERHED